MSWLKSYSNESFCRGEGHRSAGPRSCARLLCLVRKTLGKWSEGTSWPVRERAT